MILIPFTLYDFNNLASQKLNLKINVTEPYKLCDFKPAYGLIFSQYIQKYDYWGITDIDIIFGRIKEFISDEMLDYYDIISVRNDYPTGSFMIFKNNKYINELFKKSKDYQIFFLSQKHYCFDECNFEHSYLQNGGDIFMIDTEIESMHHVIMREITYHNLKAHFDFLIIEGLPGQLFWNNGILSFKNEFEVLFYHLILYKQNRFTEKNNWKNIPNQFYIDKYIIRKKYFGTILNYYIKEQLRVFLLKTLLIIDYYTSQKLSVKQKKNIKNSIYYNGKQKRYRACLKIKLEKFVWSLFYKITL